MLLCFVKLSKGVKKQSDFIFTFMKQNSQKTRVLGKCNVTRARAGNELLIFTKHDSTNTSGNFFPLESPWSQIVIESRGIT